MKAQLKTVMIICAVAVTVTAILISAVMLIKNTDKAQPTGVASVSQVSLISETAASTYSELTSHTENTEAVKDVVEVKPSTGSVLTAPEFNYNAEEDALDKETNSDKFAPQTPTVTEGVSKTIEPTGNNVNVRAGAGTNFASLGKVSIGQIFDCLGETLGTDNMIWYNIKGTIGGKLQTGYIRSDYAKYTDDNSVSDMLDENVKFEQENGSTYCYRNGELLKGYADVNGLRYYFNEITGAMESYTCIDVSKYQGDINWKSVKAFGIEYAIIRVGYRGYGADAGSGNMHIDPMFQQNITAAKAAGIKCGVYFYSTAKNINEAKEEASFVLNAIKGYSLDLPIALDIEHVGDRVAGLTAKERTDNAIAFMETIKQSGHSVMLYTYYNYYNKYLEKSRLTDYTLWMAYYTDDSSKLGDIIYDGWQYSSDGSVSGISGRCDMNVIFKSMLTGNADDNPLLPENEEVTPPIEDGASNNESVTSETSSEAII